MTRGRANAGSRRPRAAAWLARMVVHASTPGPVPGPVRRRARSGFAVALALACALAGAAGSGRAADAASERGLPLIRSFPPRAYGGTNQVWQGVVTRDGSLLFGLQNMVTAFDGLTWERIPVPNAAHVRSLAVDADDVVWVGGVNELGRIVRGPDGQRVFESLRRHVPAGMADLRDIWRIHATPEGVWFQSNEAVLRWRDGRFDVWPMGERFITLSYWLGDHLLVAREKGWYRAAAGGRWEQVGDPAANLGDYLPSFVVPHPSGSGWLMSLQGPKGQVMPLARWDGAALTFTPHPLDPFFQSKRLHAAIRLADGRYVFGTLQGGAVVLGPDLAPQTWLNESTGMPSDAAVSLVADAHGAVWFGTEFGIARVLLHPAYAWFGPANGLKRGHGHPTLRVSGRTIVGGANGLLQLLPAGDQPGLARLERWGTLDDKVTTIAAVDDGCMVGALGGLWFVAADGTAARVERSGSNIFSIVPSRTRPGRAFAASLNGLLVVRREGAAWVRDGLFPEGRSAWVYEADDGALWLGTDNQGVLQARFAGADTSVPPQITRFGPESGVPPGAAKTRILAAGGAPLFLLPAGLYRFDETSRRFRPEPAYGARFADGSTRVESAVEDARGGLWMIIRPTGSLNPNDVKQLGYARDGKWQQLPLPDLERIDGFGELRLESTAAGEVLWLNGQSVVLRIDLTIRRAVGDPPIGATVLREALVAGRRPLAAGASPPHGHLLRAAASENTVRLRFGTPGLAGEPDVRHETRLRGFGDGAAELVATGERTFTNLPAGAYVFEVRGRSADGRWSEPATLAFTVLAPWWSTRLAWAGYVLALAGGISVIVRRRTRALERERARLEAVGTHRTAELAQKNRELERLNRLEQDEKLTARLAEEKARLELLRYQLNPHFLFNSLNSIRALVYAQPEAAGEMVTRLAEFCRWTLMRGTGETTTVAEEAEMVRTYLDIEKARWQEALVTSVEIDDAVRGERLPQFLLLPLIENAIKYGGRTSEGGLEVHVSVRAEPGHLACEVANTGAWVEPAAAPSPTSTHIGLDNLRQRLARHYGPGCALEIAHGGGWVRMRLRLKRGLPEAPGRPASHEPFTGP